MLSFNPYTHLPLALILAEDLTAKYFNPAHAELTLESYTPGAKNIPYKIVGQVKGKQLTGLRYEQLMPYVKPEGDAFRVIPGDFVSTEDGTGIVHIAPTFGADDARVAKQHNVPSIGIMNEEDKLMPLVDKRGRFVAEVSDFALEYVKEAYYTDEEKEAERQKQGRDKYLSVDERISIKLKEDNKAFKVEKYEHSYPHCWRTDKPVLYYPLDSWFIKTTAVKERMVELNKSINWKPESTGSGRFGNWLENLVDWNLSRSRYWGTPLPIWRTEDGKEEICIGSIAQLEEEIAKAKKAGFANPDNIKDLHRPFVDDITLVSASGKAMKREADLIDVWFDSGAMPYAQWHYPFENKAIFDANYPADFIAEGVDQTRGWFFTLHALAVMLFDQVAFKNVIANGLVLDKNGNKMSKRLGNVINPFETLDTYGPDATRWYMIVNAPPWDNLKFNLEGVEEVKRRFIGTLSNTYSFFALYANLDAFTFKEGAVAEKALSESDRWILSRLNTLIKEVDEAYETYEPTRAARLIQDFTIDELSNWYVRLNRKRFWKGELNEDKTAAYQTLYHCLESLALLIAPIAPFYAERLYRDLNTVSQKNKAESVHLADYPKVQAAFINEELEARMRLAQIASSLVHSIRKEVRIKVRQPLQRILVPVLNASMRERLTAVKELICSEVNVKDIEFIEDTRGIVTKSIKPNFKKLGKEYGARLKEIGAAIQALDDAAIFELESKGTFTLVLGAEKINITLEDVEIRSEDIPGWSVASDQGLTVALDITISDALRKEGIARDMVNRVQNLRKDMGLEVQDKIRITIQKLDPLINEALAANKEYICAETQALSLDLIDSLPDGQSIEIDELTYILKIEK